MKLAKGNMFDHPADLYLATCNAVVNSRGELVMGRGAALEMKRRWLGCATEFGTMVHEIGGRDPSNLYFYGYLVSWKHPEIGVFQVKWHWREEADLSLIERSVQDLINNSSNLASSKISLNFPGIGNGRLDREKVLPVIERLPDNVTVWEMY